MKTRCLAVLAAISCGTAKHHDKPTTAEPSGALGPGGDDGRWGKLDDDHPAIAYGPAGSTSIVAIGTPETTGDKAVIRRHVRRQSPMIAACYDRALAAHPKLSGVVTVRFTIGRDGKVSSLAASGLTPVAACVAAIVKGIAFPPLDAEVRVTYPLTFRVAGN